MRVKEVSKSKDTRNLNLQLHSVTEEKYGRSYKDHLLEQYRLYVEMADRISSRRSSANSFFLSLNTLLVTAIGILSKFGNVNAIFNATWAAVASIGGIVLCWTWSSIIHSYKRLNSSKYRVINVIEQSLPMAPYKAEWFDLKSKKDYKYMELTSIEKWVPWVFAFLYVALIIFVSVVIIV